MNDLQILEKAKQVLKIESTAVGDLVNKLDDEFVKAVKIIVKSKGRVVLTGIGKSGLIARKIVATLNSTGTAAIFLHPTDALHGDLGMVRKGDIIIVLSKSGNTEELLGLVLMLKRMEIPLIGMVGNRNSKLGKECDIYLDVSVSEEACPHDLAPTASTTAALALGDALAVALLEVRGFTADDFALLHPAGSLGKRLSLYIREIMYKDGDLPKINENAAIKDVIFEITSKRLGTTCVIDDSGFLKGVVTDGDLRRLLEKTLEIKNLTAKDIMNENPKTMKQDFLASFAIQRMEQFNITSLIVVDDENKPVGIVHLHDLVKLGLERR